MPKVLFSRFSLVAVVVSLVAPIHGFEESRKLDQAGLPGSADPSIKCGGCSPCGSATCYLSPPPPPPLVYPSPPPPPSLPPHRKSPKTGYCPPPPNSPGFVYVGGPAGSLYPVDRTYSGSTRILTSSVFALLGYGLLSLLILILWL